MPGSLLIVDDYQGAREMTADMARLFGWRVTEASSGGEALEAVKSSSFDLILMDCEMPVLDGLQTAQRVLAYTGEQGPTIVAISAHQSPEHKAACSRAGMSEHLCKPFSLDRLGELLGRYDPET